MGSGQKLVVVVIFGYKKRMQLSTYFDVLVIGRVCYLPGFSLPD